MSGETKLEKLGRLRSRLSEAQRTFCEEFIQSCDSATAYKKAYPERSKVTERTADNLLGRWYIQDYLAALSTAAHSDDLFITKGEVLSHLTTILRSVTAEDKDRIAAAKTISQVRGFGTKKIEHSGNPNRPLNVGLDEAQILRLRAEFLGVDTKALEPPK